MLARAGASRARAFAVTLMGRRAAERMVIASRRLRSGRAGAGARDRPRAWRPAYRTRRGRCGAGNLGNQPAIGRPACWALSGYPRARCERQLDDLRQREDHAPAAAMSAGGSLRHRLFQVRVDLVEEAGGENHFCSGPTSSAKSLVIWPASTVSTVTFSSVARIWSARRCRRACRDGRGRASRRRSRRPNWSRSACPSGVAR